MYQVASGEHCTLWGSERDSDREKYHLSAEFVDALTGSELQTPGPGCALRMDYVSK